MLANAATRSLIEGSDFGDNIMASLPDVLAQTIGGMVTGGIARSRAGGKAAEPRPGDAAKGRNGDEPVVNQDAIRNAVDAMRYDPKYSDTAKILAEFRRDLTSMFADSEAAAINDARIAAYGKSPKLQASYRAAAESAVRTSGGIWAGSKEAKAVISSLDKGSGQKFDYQIIASGKDAGTSEFEGFAYKPILDWDPVNNVIYFNEASYDRDGKTLRTDGKGGLLVDQVVDKERTELMRREQGELELAAGIGLGVMFAPVALMGIEFAPAIAAGVGRAGTSAASGAVRAGTALGYEGSLATMGGSAGIKATIGLASEWGANALTGQQMTFSKGAGAVAGSVIFAPAVGKFLPGGTSLFTKLTTAGGAAGFGGNFVEQGIDFVTTGKSLSISVMAWSGAFGALGGMTGYGNMKMLPSPQYIKLPGSLMDDLVQLPAAAGAMPALITQKLVLAPSVTGGK